MTIEKPTVVKVLRVSSAQARGAAKQYSYWGIVPYEAVRTADGVWRARACRRACSEYRSLDKARRIAAESGLPVITSIGRMNPADVQVVEAYLARRRQK